MEGSVIAAIVIVVILVLVVVGFAIWYERKPAAGSGAACNAASCNATMKDLITGGSAFHSANLAACNNCPQYLYEARDNVLNYSKDGVNWTPCGSKDNCYDNMKLVERFRGGRY